MIRIRTRSLLRRSSIKIRSLLGAGSLACALAACDEPGRCGWRRGVSNPDILINRIEAFNASGQRLSATVRRELSDGSLSAPVPIGETARLDKSYLGGRSAMTVLVSASTYLDARVILPEDCLLTLSPQRVVLERAP
jgi:hypothetical protein